MVRLQRQALAEAVITKQLGPGAIDEAPYVTSVLVSGVIGQAMANEPGPSWGEGASAAAPHAPRSLAALYSRSQPAPAGRQASALAGAAAAPSPKRWARAYP